MANSIDYIGPFNQFDYSGDQPLATCAMFGIFDRLLFVAENQPNQEFLILKNGNIYRSYQRGDSMETEDTLFLDAEFDNDKDFCGYVRDLVNLFSASGYNYFKNL